MYSQRERALLNASPRLAPLVVWVRMLLGLVSLGAIVRVLSQAAERATARRANQQRGEPSKPTSSAQIIPSARCR
jgi:hypothetical protein